MPRFRYQWERDSYHKHLENYLESKRIEEDMVIYYLHKQLMIELASKVACKNKNEF